MNSRERAINLGLKINSLKGNFSVAKSVIRDLEDEVKSAVIEEEDRERLLVLYKNVVADLKSAVSPSTEERGRLNQMVEDGMKKIKSAKTYSELSKVDGFISNLEEQIEKSKLLNKEHKAALNHRVRRLIEKYKSTVTIFLKKNFDKLKKEIVRDCDNKNPFNVSVAVKNLNGIVKKTPLYQDDREELQALLDTYWQKSARDIKAVKTEEKLND
ncbi:MAG: hypothetical protein JXR64_01655 [Spirochaetales bacterium]|nr:hypothetical protein [Spirochaetales bacterium]